VSARIPDPEAMTAEARMAELGDLIATGLRRLSQNLESAVAERAPVEPRCVRPVDAQSAGQEVDHE
jgi:hypothetical protein